MNISKRQNELLNIINDKAYVSVNELAKLTYTSPSSIRRDLTIMQNVGLVKRLHGGVCLPEKTERVASFYNRSTKNVKEKKIIAEKASKLLQDGQSILLDSSTTASYMLQYIAKLESPILFTNNLETAISAIKLGIHTHCIGGTSINGSISLGGIQTKKALEEINVDIMFFSSQSINFDGYITDSTDEENYVRSIMLKRANKKVFLCDSTKFNTISLYTLTNVNDLDFLVFNEEYKELKTKTKIIK